MSQPPTQGLRQEIMSPTFTKYHLPPGPYPCMVLHHFTGPDGPEFHSHPWGFVTHVLTGGYSEQVLDPATGLVTVWTHAPGSSRYVSAETVHRVSELTQPTAGCWTLVLPGPPELETRFYRHGPRGVESRAWHQPWTD